MFIVYLTINEVQLLIGIYESACFECKYCYWRGHTRLQFLYCGTYKAEEL